jgi:outer membrane lipoprotein-sorting protein
MGQKSIFGAVLSILTILFISIVFIESGVAAEFTADMIQKTQAASFKSQVFVKGEMIRNEMDMKGTQQVSISRLDKGVVWVLMPGQMYMEMPLSAGGEDSLLTDQKKLEEVATKEDLGKEKVNGYACDKYRFTFNDKSMGTMTQWFSKKLNFPIKSVMMGSQGEISTEYKNINEQKLADSLFEVPAGYNKMQMQGMPKMPGAMNQ